MMPAIFNRQLKDCQADSQIGVEQPWVDAAHDAPMQQKHGKNLSDRSQRVRELVGKDTLKVITQKLAVQGVSVSEQAVHKWFNGGNISDENVLALASAYRSTPEWIKYGTGPKYVLTEGQQAAAELAGADDIREEVQAGFDFIRYKIEQSPLLANDPATAAHYLKMIDAIIRGTKK